LQRASRKFDGGYVMAGLVGHGDAFVFRDPSGIRPAFYYHDDEIVVVASERPAIQTCIDVQYDDVKELQRGHAIIIKKDGTVEEKLCKDQLERKACSFERIYFSRGTDRDIYLERKKLGELLVPQILKAINYDFKNTIFSFIPNTAEVSFYGMVEGLRKAANVEKKKRIQALGPDASEEEIEKILAYSPRIEKLTVKDAKLRTFIADDAMRNSLVSHVYDVTYGIVKNEVDTLVLIDDSIVRGTTLRESILQSLSRLKPKKIIIVSSAPQIRYPDCYGIDMSKMKSFVAFNALVELLKETKQEHLLEEAYENCLIEEEKPIDQIQNKVQALYDLFDYEQVSKKIAEIVTPPNIDPEIEVIYQTVENLQEACPDNNGDWYFTGDYPTVGGTRVVNRSFINYMNKSEARAY